MKSIQDENWPPSRFTKKDIQAFLYLTAIVALFLIGGTLDCLNP